LGITPEAIAALGMNASQTTSLLDSLGDAGVELSTLASLEQQSREIQTQLQQALNAVKTFEEEEDRQPVLAQIVQLEAEHENLRSSLEQQKDLIRLTLFPSQISPAVIERVCDPSELAALVPHEFRVATLTENDYTELIPALREEARAARAGRDIDAEAAQTLQHYRSLPAVEDARSNMYYNLELVRGVFFN